MYKLARAFPSFLKNAIDKGLLLILATVIAFVFANTDVAPLYYELLHSKISFISDTISIGIPLHAIVNDMLMSIFFLIVGIEIKKEITSGHLATKSQRILPIACAMCGVIGPMVIYIIFNHGTDAIKGWAIPTATDIAFTLAVMSLFASTIPMSIKVFVTALAIIDDLIAVIVIALFYTETLHGLYIIGIIICIIMLLLLNRSKVCYLQPYILIGVIMWYCFFFSGIHATVAGVVLGFLIPCDVETPENNTAKLGKTLEKHLQPFSTYLIMPIFAFFNAGVSVIELELQHILNGITASIILGLFFGKQIGIFSSFYILVKTKLVVMPENATYFLAYVASVMCGIGFTMSLFVAALAFDMHSIALMSSKVGILIGSLLSCTFGALLLMFVRK